ncbi:unnamed protein product, partial [Ascophyllum nodosum]
MVSIDLPAAPTPCFVGSLSLSRGGSIVGRLHSLPRKAEVQVNNSTCSKVSRLSLLFVAVIISDIYLQSNIFLQPRREQHMKPLSSSSAWLRTLYHLLECEPLLLLLGYERFS